MAQIIQFPRASGDIFVNHMDFDTRYRDSITCEVERLRFALWCLAGDVEAFSNCGARLTITEQANLAYARFVLSDWKPKGAE